MTAMGIEPKGMLYRQVGDLLTRDDADRIWALYEEATGAVCGCHDGYPHSRLDCVHALDVDGAAEVVKAALAENEGSSVVMLHNDAEYRDCNAYVALFYDGDHEVAALVSDGITSDEAYIGLAEMIRDHLG
jgi:hypothetical protein